MIFVTKPCQCCDSIMVNVNRQTRFCEECKRIKGNAAARAAKMTTWAAWLGPTTIQLKASMKQFSIPNPSICARAWHL